jgi:CCR4-NOT transcription complex subunit 4
MEDLDITDRNFRPCKCGYQICLFCYRHIKDDLNGLCPACRTPYDDSNVTFVAPDPQECVLHCPAALLPSSDGSLPMAQNWTTTTLGPTMFHP